MTLIDPTALVLVAVMPEPRDLEIARLLGWYRIPLRSAPKLLSVDFLAFYLPASFGESGGRISFAAPVLGHELVIRRALLKDEPDHPAADQEYYKINLGALIRLPGPIAAGRWKRFSFIYTTGERLVRAGSLNDLTLRAEDRDEIWRALRERSMSGREYRALQDPTIEKDVLFEILKKMG